MNEGVLKFNSDFPMLTGESCCTMNTGDSH